MKITETIERECCEERDLKPYGGKTIMCPSGKTDNCYFSYCSHCGQLWFVPPSHRCRIEVLIEDWQESQHNVPIGCQKQKSELLF